MNFIKYQDVLDDILNYEKLIEKIKNPQTFIVKLFPYFANNNEGNIAKYARGKDYHIVVQEKLQEIINEYKENFPENEFISFCDISPLDEVKIAYKSGAGILGKNRLIFDEKYGGYVFIGIIVTDLIINFQPKMKKDCINCKLCEKRCPQNAISENGIDEMKCLSYITQKNGEINPEILEKSAWGCDICLDICPMNRNIEQTYIDEFKENLIYNLKICEIENLTRKQFNEKFPQRAFTFRGTTPIVRNLSCLEFLTVQSIKKR